MKAKSLLLLAGLATFTLDHASAQLRITEVMSDPASSSTHPDWFELTNYGAVSLSLDSNWRMDDNSYNYSLGATLQGITSIAPGESVVYIEGTSTDATNLAATWSLSGVQVGYYSASAVSFSSGGDGVAVFSDSSTEAAIRLSFGAAVNHASFYWTYSTGSGTPISGPTGGTSSVVGVYGATSAAGSIGSPGIAPALTSPTTLNWIGGSGDWTASGGTNWEGGAWDSSKTAIFATSSGTVNVATDVAALGLDIRTDGYVLSGPGSINTSQVGVLNDGDTARIDSGVTGSSGLAKFGAGILELGASNTYTGVTSVSQGVLKLVNDNVIPDASTVSVALSGTFDLNGHSDTVAGLAGLGAVNIGSGTLTVANTGTSNVEFDGWLHGSGDFVVDGTGSGDQIFNTTAATLAAGAVKDYTGATIIRDGVLRVNDTAVPTATSQVLIEGGKLRLSTGFGDYTFGGDPGVQVVLGGGAIRQDDGESVTLENVVNATADSSIESYLDSADPTATPVLTLNGAISGTAGLAIKGGGVVRVANNGSYSGTFSAVGSYLEMNGHLASSHVLVDSTSSLAGTGEVSSIGGAGQVSPGSEGPGVLTTGIVDPSTGMSFAFEYTQAGSDFSGNDVLRIKDAGGLGAGLTSANTVDIFLSVASLSPGDLFLGGLYLDGQTNFDSLIRDANFAFYIYGDGNGTDAFLNGFGYYSLADFDPSAILGVSSVGQSADFGDGTVNGGIMQVAVVPEPQSWALIACGILVLGWTARRRLSASPRF